MAITAGKTKTVLRGTFKGGVIVLDDIIALPEGTVVTVNLTPPLPEVPAELREDFAFWDKASADAWQIITEWEREADESPESLA